MALQCNLPPSRRCSPSMECSHASTGTLNFSFFQRKAHCILLGLGSTFYDDMPLYLLANFMPILLCMSTKLVVTRRASVGGAGETGSTQHQPQPLRLLPRSVILVSSFQNRGTSILWRSNTVKTPGPRIS
eukprot:1151991-Pelagomonas_calceolata.AAC.1